MSKDVIYYSGTISSFSFTLNVLLWEDEVFRTLGSVFKIHRPVGTYTSSPSTFLSSLLISKLLQCRESEFFASSMRSIYQNKCLLNQISKSTQFKQNHLNLWAYDTVWNAQKEAAINWIKEIQEHSALCHPALYGFLNGQFCLRRVIRASLILVKELIKTSKYTFISSEILLYSNNWLTKAGSREKQELTPRRTVYCCSSSQSKLPSVHCHHGLCSLPAKKFCIFL